MELFEIIADEACLNWLWHMEIVLSLPETPAFQAECHNDH